MEGLKLLTGSLYFKLIVGALIAYLGTIMINKFVSSFFERTNFIEEKKEKTIESMIHSMVKYAMTTGYILFALGAFGVDYTKLLAGAGVIGIIIGLGAQSIIKDILSGLFLIYEKQLHKGDFIKINGKYTGTVEDLGLRFLKIREWSGKLLTVSNGHIKEIQNYNIDKMRVIESVTTSFYEDPEKVMKALQEACDTLNKNNKSDLLKNEKGELVEPFQIYGMTNLNDNQHGYGYTVVALVKDDVYWAASKETRRAIANAMHNHQIKMAEENKYYRTRLN